MTDTEVSRRTRGRSPYLVSNTKVDQSSWWEGLSVTVNDWLRNNPLHLGIEDSSVPIIQAQLARGNTPNCSSELLEKSFIHILIEFEGVAGNPVAKFAHEIVNLNGYTECKAILAKYSTLLRRYSGQQASTILAPLSRSPSRQPTKQFDLDAEGGNDSLADLVRLKTSSALEIDEYLEDIESKKDMALPHDFDQDAKEERKLPPPPTVPLSVATSPQVVGSFGSTTPRSAKPPSTKTRRASFSGDRSDSSVSPSRADRRRASDAGTSPVKEKRGSPRRRNSLSKGGSPAKGKSPRRKSSISSIVQATSVASRRKKESVSSSLLDSCKTALDQAKRRSSIDSVASAGYYGADESDYTVTASLALAREGMETLKRSGFDDQQSEGEEVEQETQEEAEVEGKEGKKEDGQGEDEDDNGLRLRNRVTYKFSDMSTPQRGRIQIRDSSKFQLDSFYKKRDRGTAQQGITLMMGRNEETLREQVVSVIFDRTKLSEEEASDWLNENITRFITEDLTHEEALCM